MSNFYLAAALVLIVRTQDFSLEYVVNKAMELITPKETKIPLMHALQQTSINNLDVQVITVENRPTYALAHLLEVLQYDCMGFLLAGRTGFSFALD